MLSLLGRRNSFNVLFWECESFKEMILSAWRSEECCPWDFACAEKLLQTLQHHAIFQRSMEFAAIKEYWKETWWDLNSFAICYYRYVKLYSITFSSIWSFFCALLQILRNRGFENSSIWRNLQILYENGDLCLLNYRLFALLVFHRPLTCTQDLFPWLKYVVNRWPKE